ncbi:unnamed protein product [Rangifer tarandus platyrhynchus]|uniref:Uncharacterized protein n=1 Tax=Rangifer tarandus platyrhynchus TaxID=3082113 RepID=A0AC59ZZG3_RANTA
MAAVTNSTNLVAKNSTDVLTHSSAGQKSENAISKCWQGCLLFQRLQERIWFFVFVFLLFPVSGGCPHSGCFFKASKDQSFSQPITLPPLSTFKGLSAELKFSWSAT